MRRRLSTPNFARQEATQELAQLGSTILHAFQALAEAGAPRCPKPHRAKKIEAAHKIFDVARAKFTSARWAVQRVQKQLRDAEQQHKASGAYYDKPKAHLKAAVTQLEPQVRGLELNLNRLRECLLGYLGGQAKRGFPSHESQVASDRRSHFSAEPHMPCAWCGRQEDTLRHNALDEAGYVTSRSEARRFCCFLCFSDGRDLIEPQPKIKLPERAATLETVECLPVTHELPAMGDQS